MYTVSIDNWLIDWLACSYERDACVYGLINTFLTNLITDDYHDDQCDNNDIIKWW